MVSQILFLSQPRTACHLLERMLVSQQPDVNKLAHPFASARASQRRLLQDQTSGEPSVEVVSALRLAWEEGFETWKEAVKDAEATVRRHPLSNDTQPATPLTNTPSIKSSSRTHTATTSPPQKSHTKSSLPKSPHKTSPQPGPFSLTIKQPASASSPTPSSCTQPPSLSSRFGTPP